MAPSTTAGPDLPKAKRWKKRIRKRRRPLPPFFFFGIGMKVHTARGTYRCTRCKLPIEPGQRYARMPSNFYHYPGCYFKKKKHPLTKEKEKEKQRKSRAGTRGAAWARRTIKKQFGVSGARQIASQRGGRGWRKR